MPIGNDYFDEHVRSREKKPPATLYKYTTVETARIILSTGKLRFQSPLRYNDPFDSQWDSLWPISTPEAREYERVLAEQALRDPNVWPANADPKFKRAMDWERARIEALPEEHRTEAIAQFGRDAIAGHGMAEPLVQRVLDMRRKMRVFCLSESDRSLLMWSHYASQHRGIVLGFDVATIENTLKRPLEPVKYCDGPPCLIDHKAWSQTVTFGCPSPELKNEREWALAKHTDWGYEREWRFVWIANRGTIGEHEDFKFPSGALVEVVSGCRTETERATAVFALARTIKDNVRLYQLSPHPARFELVKTEVTSQ